MDTSLYRRCFSQLRFVVTLSSIVTLLALPTAASAQNTQRYSGVSTYSAPRTNSANADKSIPRSLQSAINSAFGGLFPNQVSLPIKSFRGLNADSTVPNRHQYISPARTPVARPVTRPANLSNLNARARAYHANRLQQATYSVQESDAARTANNAPTSEPTIAFEEIGEPDAELIPFGQSESPAEQDVPVQKTDGPPASGPVAPAMPAEAFVSDVPDNPFDDDTVEELSAPDSSTTDTPPPANPAVTAESPVEVTAALPAIVAGTLTVETVQTEISRIESDESSPAEERAALIGHYKNAIASIESVNNSAAARKKLLAQIEVMKTSASDATEHSATWDAKQKTPYLSQPGTPAPELKKQLDEFESELKTSEASLATAESQLASISENRKANESQLSELAAAFEKSSPGFPPETSAEETLALTMEHNAERQAERGLAGLLQAKLQHADMQTMLLKVQQATETKRAQWLRKSVLAASNALTALRAEEARVQQEESIRLSNIIHPKLQKHADRNIELADRNAGLATLIKKVRDENSDKQKTLTALNDNRKEIVDRKNETGLTNTLGLLMRNRRAHLPELGPLSNRLGAVQNEMEAVSDESMRLEDQRDRFGDFTKRVRDVIRETQLNDETQLPSLTNSADTLLSKREELLSSTLDGLEQYTEALATLGNTTDRLLTTSDEYAHFIDEHVLWIRSTSRLGMDDLKKGSEATVAVADPENWSNLALTLYGAGLENAIPAGIVGIIVLFMFTFGSEFRSRLQTLGERAAGEPSRQALLATAEAILITLLISLTMPVLMYGVGWLLSAAVNASDFAVSLGKALMTTAGLYGLLEVLRQVCRRGGLADLHFGWDKEGLKQIHALLPKVILVGLPLVGAVVFFQEYESGQWKNSVGRMIFIVGMLLLWQVLRKILHPTEGALQLIARSGFATWVGKTSWLWYVIANVCPIALAILAFNGYYYTAEQLAGCLQTTFSLALVLILGQALLGRGIDTLQHMHRHEVKAELEAELEATGELSEEVQETLKLHAAENGGAAEAIGARPGSKDAMDYLDEFANSMQLHRLVQISVIVVLFGGAWHIWSNVLPAITAVTDYELWQTTTEIPIAQTSTTATGETGDAASTGMQSIRQTVWITLGDVLLAVLISCVTFVAARNLPALLETIVLKRLPFDRGARHAISTIASYVLSVTGVMMAFGSIGITWSSVQWLVAAMTVGLGFGLQEIFGNFVSGIIILFERPIRIGDFVTVANETGWVQRIQFRATTIQDVSRREIIVPNKKFITDQLVNWTLTDPITRVVVPVGVAYGTDTTLTQRLLMEIAEEHPMVLETPAPSAVMKAFGDSTLDFELRCFIPEREGFADVIHDLATAIDRRFLAANIEIAFPQRDLNIRGLEKIVSEKMKAA